MKTRSKMLTTGQAAKYCSVTPDTILKWIRSGFLPAKRTAGGHHRIDLRDLKRVFLSSSLQKTPVSRSQNKTAFRYCWEFNGDGIVPEGCFSCAVYRMRAQRCYEVIKAAPDADHLKLFCTESCENCDYYQVVRKESINVLIVSNDKALIQELKRDADNFEFNLEFADCEYACSSVLNTFRPDFAIVDCSIGPERGKEICRHLNEDPRIPFVRIILASSKQDFPPSCDKEIFARIKSPFTILDIASCLENLQKPFP